MRLTEEQVHTLKSSIFEITKDCKVYLFGSRTDDNARGGDIDILVESVYFFKMKDIFKIRNQFWKIYGEQKIDIICYSPEDDSPFKKIALSKAIEL